MPEEVVYTSAEKGIDPKSKGYCIVARTKKLSYQVAERLVQLSSYRHFRDPEKTPTNYSHTKFQSKSSSFHLLSRIGDGGNDYSNRRCLFAHHISEGDLDKLCSAGPAWTCANKSLFYKEWNIKPGYLRERELPAGQFEIEECRIWNSRLGSDAGARKLAKSATSESPEPIYVVFEPSLRLLPLFVEAIALVPIELRWQVTFSTYFPGPVPGIECLWRGVVKNSEQHKKAIKHSSPIIDLT